MKVLSVFSAAILVALFTGCETPRQTSTASLSGPGTKRVYLATFDQTWRATANSMRRSDFTVVRSDRTASYMEARRMAYSRPLDENIGIWVRSLTPTQTEVEVVDRQSGPPVLALVNREIELQSDIAANLAREVPPMGTAPRSVVVEPGGSTTTIITTDRRDVLTPERRESLQREVDRLRDDIRTQEQRLRDLERELK